MSKAVDSLALLVVPGACYRLHKSKSIQTVLVDSNSTRTDHAPLSGLIPKHNCRSMPRRLRIITDTNGLLVRAGGCRLV